MNINKLFKDKKIFILLFVFIAAGMLFMLGGSNNIEYEKTETQVKADDDLEQRLESILSEVKGAGKVRVMITYKAGGEKIIAYNTDKESENKDAGFSSNEKNEIALSKDSPVVLKEIYPEIEGVLIVAQGGANIEVKNNLISASIALLPIDVNKIEVLVMKKEA